MTDRDTPREDLRELAERAMTEKLVESGDEARTRELYDVPTETAEELEEGQKRGAED
jgi:hypothetical protein